MEDSILRQEEESGLASAELRQLRSDLREALALFGTAPTSETTTECLVVSSDSESSDDDEDDEEDSVVKEIVGKFSIFCVFRELFSVGTNCSVKITCPISGIPRHNAVVLDIESATDNTVSTRTLIDCLNV